MVEIVVSYAAGTQDMLVACLSSLRRHDAGEPFCVKVLCGDHVAYSETAGLMEVYGALALHYDSTGAKSSSGRHARMLDAALAESRHEHFLSLDSDCFPVADGWLSRIMAQDCDVSGILWPWVPPPESVAKETIEYRLRRQHCWSNTQVACQLLRTEAAKDLGLRFADLSGDDNNFALMDKVHAAGLKVGGLMPSCCALPDDREFDPEMNRQVCVVYGEAVYHHGGASREKKGEMYVADALFGTARRRTLAERGAEWMMEPGMHHDYRMDDEEGVAQFKMRMLYRDAVTFLGTRSSLFGGGWA